MEISCNDELGGAVLNCAVRYALGRISYMPGLVMNAISPMLKDCSDKTLWCFERDVSEWLSNNSQGMITYEKEWTEFLNAVRAEINRRTKHNEI